jgi:hypothetical protein
MRPVSPKRARTLAQRRDIQAREHGRPPCARQAICGNAADDLHEIVRRSQADSAARVDLQVWLCRGCHDWVGEHPAEAAAEGLHMTGAVFRRAIAASETNGLALADSSAIVVPMPPKDDDRVNVNVRISRAGVEELDRRIGQLGQSRAEVIRTMLTFAATYMDDHGKLRLIRRPPRPQPKPSQGGRG